MISIYVHIPFCVKKCAYCDFLSFPCDEETRQRYVDCLCKEIDACSINDREVATIFFGGGTPSILGADQIGQIMDKIKERFNITEGAEISLECNPGTASEEKLKGFMSAGINRLSIGLQSASDDELKNLGRIHNYNQFLVTYNLARKVGFKNINIDLMNALPGQTIESFRDTLTKVVTLKPQHLSVYSLIIEENTEFWDLYGGDSSVSEGAGVLPDEDAERAMYYMTEEVLDQFGYHRYEISNYALSDCECKHNIVYWTGGDYVSFGIGAASYVSGVRYNNISDVMEYMRIWEENDQDSMDSYENDFIEISSSSKKDEIAHTEIQRLSQRDKMEEYMFLGLRMMKGVSISGFKSRFDSDMMDVYGDVIDKYCQDGFLIVEGDRLFLSRKGIDVSNVILADFLLD